MAISGNSIATKGFQLLTVNDDLLVKLVEATVKGEKEAKSSGIVKSFEVISRGFRQQIAIGRLFIVPAKICNSPKDFPTALLYGTIVRELNLGEEVADLISSKIGESEFDEEYSQADFEDIKSRLFTDEEGNETSLIIFAPAWSNIRDYVAFKFVEDEEKLSNLLRHLVFAAYYNPAVSSAFNALMTTVDTMKLDVTDITPKLTYPFLTENPLKEFPDLTKQASSVKRIFLTSKTADEITKETLEPAELNVFEALDAALTGVALPETKPVEELDDFKAPNVGNAIIPEVEVAGTPKAAAKNCTICGKPIVLKPSAQSRAKATGGTPADYTNTFTTHPECHINKYKQDTSELIKKHYSSEDDGTELRHRPDYGEKGSYTQKTNVENEKTASAPFETPFTNVGPGTNAHNEADQTIAVKVDSVSQKGEEPVGIDLDETGLPEHKTAEVGVTHYKLTLDEAKKLTPNYIDPKTFSSHPWMLCRTGDGHAEGTRDKTRVNCTYCQNKIKKEPISEEKKASHIAREIAREIPGTGGVALSSKAKVAEAKRQTQLDKMRTGGKKKADVPLTEESIWDDLTEVFGEAPQVELPGDGSSKSEGSSKSPKSDTTTESSTSKEPTISEPSSPESKSEPKKETSQFKSNLFGEGKEAAVDYKTHTAHKFLPDDSGDKCRLCGRPYSFMLHTNRSASIKSAKELSVPEKHQLRIALDTVKNPAKALLGGPSVEEAKEIILKLTGKRVASAKTATWLNSGEVEEAMNRFASDPVMGPVTKFLYNFVEEVNNVSDGWHSWPLPARAASKLMDLIKSQRAYQRDNFGWGEGHETSPVTVQDVAKAMAPIKAFMTRSGQAAGMTMPKLIVKKGAKSLVASAKLAEVDMGQFDAAKTTPSGDKPTPKFDEALKNLRAETEHMNADEFKEYLKKGSEVRPDIAEAKSKVVSPDTLDSDIKQPTKSVEEAAKVAVVVTPPPGSTKEYYNDVDDPARFGDSDRNQRAVNDLGQGGNNLADSRKRILEAFSNMKKNTAKAASAPLDKFTQAYIEAALWSSMDDEGAPLDAKYGVEDIAPSTLAAFVRDCKQFQEQNSHLFVDCRRSNEYTIDQMAGHDFWLTRSGHGAGFWDGDWPTTGDELTKASKKFGEPELYVGDDGYIYQYGTETPDPVPPREEYNPTDKEKEDLRKGGIIGSAKNAGAGSQFSSLDDLCNFLNSDVDCKNKCIFFDKERSADITDLPTFGGTPPEDLLGIYSWDEKRIMVQSDNGDWAIQRRIMGTNKKADVSSDLSEAKSELDAGAKSELADSPKATKTVNPAHFAAEEEAVQHLTGDSPVTADTLELAQQLIDLEDEIALDVCATYSQILGNVKHMRWLREAVAEEIAGLEEETRQHIAELTSAEAGEVEGDFTEGVSPLATEEENHFASFVNPKAASACTLQELPDWAQQKIKAEWHSVKNPTVKLTETILAKPGFGDDNWEKDKRGNCTITLTSTTGEHVGLNNVSQTKSATLGDDTEEAIDMGLSFGDLADLGANLPHQDTHTASSKVAGDDGYYVEFFLDDLKFYLVNRAGEEQTITENIEEATNFADGREATAKAVEFKRAMISVEPEYAGAISGVRVVPAAYVGTPHTAGAKTSAYTDRNFKTKKELKDALARGEKITIYEPGPFGGAATTSGRVTLEGPHYPEPHRWYATAIIENGIVVKVS